MAKKDRKPGLTRKPKFAKVRIIVRDAIKKEMDRRDIGAYRLAQMVKGKVTAQAVYDYIGGRSDMNSRFASHLLTALGLKITEGKQ